jgi:hypothetical protein
MRVLALLLLSFTLFGSRAEADAFTSADLHPLLRVHAVHSDQILSTQQTIFQDEDYFISRGGALLFQLVSQLEAEPFKTLLVRGVGLPAEVAALKQVLSDSRVGTLTDCEVPDGADRVEPYELTWYGREGRRNTFVAFFAPAGSTSLPVCPPQVLSLRRAVSDYFVHVTQLPGSENLVAN